MELDNIHFRDLLIVDQSIKYKVTQKWSSYTMSAE